MGEALKRLTIPSHLTNTIRQSGSGDARSKEEVRTSLQGVSEWFDDYLGGEQGDGLEQVRICCLSILPGHPAYGTLPTL